jgi:hypothetical protein
MVCKICKMFGHYAKTCEQGLEQFARKKPNVLPPKTKVFGKYTHNQYTGPNNIQDKIFELCDENRIRSVVEMCLFFGVRNLREINHFMLPWVIERCPEHVEFAKEHNKAALIDSCNNWRLRAINKMKIKYNREIWGKRSGIITDDPFDLFPTESFEHGKPHPSPTHQSLENNPFN